MSRSRLAHFGLLALSAVLALAVMLAAAGCSGSSSSSEEPSSGSGSATGLPPSSDPTLDAAREIIETKCAMCHTLDRVKTAEKDRAEWQTTIDRMRSNGLVTTDEEVTSMLDYLESR